MSRWFRFYDDALNDPKVQKLPGDTFKSWVNLLCLASKHSGILPALDEITFALRFSSVSETNAFLDQLTASGLLDISEGHFRPHNWSARQYESDTSTSRVKKHRERQRKAAPEPSTDPPRNVSSYVSVTAPETDSEQKDRDGNARAREETQGNFEQAIEFSMELAVIAGHDREFLPPAWMSAGPAMRVQMYIKAGWQIPIMREIAQAVMRKKSDGPPVNIKYFERAFARAHAQQADLPLPPTIVSSSQPEVIHAQAAFGHRPRSSFGYSGLSAKIRARSAKGPV